MTTPYTIEEVNEYLELVKLGKTEEAVALTLEKFGDDEEKLNAFVDYVTKAAMKASEQEELNLQSGEKTVKETHLEETVEVEGKVNATESTEANS